MQLQWQGQLGGTGTQDGYVGDIDCRSRAAHRPVDGVQVASDASATVGQSYTGSWRVAYDNLGSWPSAGGYYFKGLMDEVAIYPTQLSAATVSAHYAANPP